MKEVIKKICIFLVSLSLALQVSFKAQASGKKVALFTAGSFIAFSVFTGKLGVKKISKALSSNPVNYGLLIIGYLLIRQSARDKKNSDKSNDAVNILASPDDVIGVGNDPIRNKALTEIANNKRKLEALLEKNKDKLSKLPFKYNSKTNSLQYRDGSPIEANIGDLKKLGLSEEDAKKVLKDLEKNFHLAAQLKEQFLKNIPRTTASTEKKDDIITENEEESLSQMLKNLSKKEEKKVDVNSLYKNINGERIGLSEGDIFEMVHKIYKKRLDNEEFFLEENEKKGSSRESVGKK